MVDMRKLRTVHRVIIAIAIQVVLVLSIIPAKLVLSAGGTTVYIPVTAVEAPGAGTGTYSGSVNLVFEISAIPPNAFDYPDIEEGDRVFVPVVQERKVWEQSGKVSKTMNKGGGVSILGTVVDKEVKGKKTVNIDIDYGIEKYEVPADISVYLKQLVQEKKTIAKISVDENGVPKLEQLYAGGKPWP